MRTMISIDAGGSKCNAIMFDDQFNILGRGLSGGVNLTQTSIENARENVADCLDQLFSSHHPRQIDTIYIVFIGPEHILHEELQKRTHVIDLVPLNEPIAGLLAGAMRTEGILALAGTGSDIFYIRKDASLNAVVGAWGPILGDQGSGAWIGTQALRAVVKGVEGWAPRTLVYDLLKRDWMFSKDFDMVHMVHRSVAPYRKVASIAPLVAEAAYAGDAIAIKILQDAGDLMATQTICMIERQGILPEYRQVVCCGGAWKTHPLMYTTFYDKLKGNYTDIQVEKPWFEHVMVGPVQEMLKQGVDKEEARRALTKRFPDYVIKW